MFHSWNVPPRYVASDDDTFITGLLYASIRILNNLMLVQTRKQQNQTTFVITISFQYS